jgi:hypothetical protein
MFVSIKHGSKKKKKAHTTVSTAVQMKKASEYHLNPVIASLVLYWFIGNRQGSPLRCLSHQLPTPNPFMRVNADHRIFFSMWPLRQIVVMGPNRVSAKLRNKSTSWMYCMLVTLVWECSEYNISFVTCVSVQACTRLTFIKCCCEEES